MRSRRTSPCKSRQALSALRLAPVCPRRQAQSERIAQILNQDYGSATITHPFHPLKGQTFAILKIRKYPHGKRYSLLSEDDVFCVPESWISSGVDNGSDRSPFNTEVLHALLGFSHMFDKMC